MIRLKVYGVVAHVPAFNDTFIGQVVAFLNIGSFVIVLVSSVICSEM